GFHLHKARVVRGSIKDGVSGKVSVATTRRADVMRNHTGTHLLHWALRRVLGTETTQAGSLVHPEYLRFDYTASKAPTDEQLAQVEDLVNQQVLRDLHVAKSESSFDEAKAAGAMALFGEKYGDRVRVVKVVDAELGAEFESTELCGGTHVARTGQIGVLKIVSDGAIAAGVRRIVAVTGTGTVKLLRDKSRAVRAVAELLKAREDDVAARVEHLLAERSRLEKELARTRRDAALGALDSIRGRAIDMGGTKVLVHTAEGLGADELRALADALIEPAAVVVLAGIHADQVALVAACGDASVKRGVKAGDIVRDLGKQLGGGGGGKPTLAQGQGKDVGALEATLRSLVDGLRQKLGS
ncbi:MAG: alanine--tRNA ligase, partial [Planctomycetes bacterium]|nr:alanine--tRNA ligase [Planctomycetota bacterium]